MAQPYLTAAQLKRTKQKGDKYYPNACTRCGCGIRITKGRVNAPTCHGESGQARKACDALLVARLQEQEEREDEDEHQQQQLEKLHVFARARGTRPHGGKMGGWTVFRLLLQNG